MKIEIGENLMLSWVKHVKGCQIATLNWKLASSWELYNDAEIESLVSKINNKFASDVFGKAKDAKQIMSQAELDVLGLNVENNHVKDFYAIDVAFHENGLLYKDNINKITEKLLRAALVLYSVFNTKTGNIVFASPKVQPKDVISLSARTKEIEDFMSGLGFKFKFYFICNQDFYEDILLPVKSKISEIKDTSELFVRSLQMLALFKNETAPVSKNDDVLKIKTGIRVVTDRQSGSTTDYDNNLVGFCFSCGHKPLYPYLNQTEAFEAAARTLGLKSNTLKNIRDYFDRYNPHKDSPRVGWDMPLTDIRKEILNKYVNKINQAYDEARKILGIK